MMERVILFGLYPYGPHPHGAIMEATRAMYEMGYVLYEREKWSHTGGVNMDALEKIWTKGFKKNEKTAFVYQSPEGGGDALAIANCWTETSYDFEEFEINLPEIYFDPNRYTTYVNGYDWRFWESIRAFEFPLVSYSRAEIEAWLVWAIKKDFLPRFPVESYAAVLELMEYFVDIKESEELMRLKLSGVVPWEFGPARKIEPNFDLWHELTKVPELNAMVENYPNNRPPNIEWWKSQLWASKYEMDWSGWSF